MSAQNPVVLISGRHSSGSGTYPNAAGSTINSFYRNEFGEDASKFAFKVNGVTVNGSYVLQDGTVLTETPAKQSSAL